MEQTIKTTYREAMREAIREAMTRDKRVFLMGEDVGRYGGCFAVSKGLLQEFGSERIIDTPLSESTFVGTGIGAALNGMRPIVEVMTVNFSQNVLSETNRFKLIIDKEADLKGLPENVAASAAEMAKQDTLAGKWVFTVQKPSMLPFLTYDENRDLRKKL